VAETSIIDSISYKKIHNTALEISNEAAAVSATLSGRGYIDHLLAGQKKINDSTFLFTYSVGRRTRSVHIATHKLSASQKALLTIVDDTLKLAPAEIEAFMTDNIRVLERKGYSISSLRLVNHRRIKDVLMTDLDMKVEKIRTIDGLVLEGYPKFPEGIRRNILKQYKGKTFNQENLQRIYNDFSAIRFVNQVRYPEILFKEDSTKVYVYLEKGKPNAFDGYLGFNNDDGGKIIFTGYIDLLLNNVLNNGEKFNLYWKSDGNEQSTFNTGIELPYVFRSPIGLKAYLRIFKQDSTFQNTVTDVNLGYYFNYNSRLYLGHQATQSVDIQNAESATLRDYSNSFWTTSYEYSQYNIDDFLFRERTSLLVKGGLGDRTAKDLNASQYFVQLNVAHNFYLNKKNIINIKSNTYYLNSNGYILNELYRFGGINSIRGFNENSLQANLATLLMAEYRYVLAPNIYVHSITDYGYFQDETANLNGRLLGFGFGFGLLTKTGRFNIVYANGSTENQQIKLSNSIVHLSFNTTF